MPTRIERNLASVLLILSVIVNKCVQHLSAFAEWLDRLYCYLLYRDTIGMVDFFITNPDDLNNPHGYIIVQYQADEGMQRLKLGFHVYNKHKTHAGLTHRNIHEIRTAAMLEGYRPLWVIYKDRLINPHREIPVSESYKLMSALNVQA